MAENAETKTPPPPEDITKLKETVGNLEKTNTQILQAINAMKAAATPPKKETKKEPAPKKDLKDVWFDDQEAAAQIIEERAERRMNERLQQLQHQNQKTTSVMQALYKDYPELASTEHPLTQKAIEIFEKLSDEEKASPLAYKLAVRDAAEELEIKPKGKRKVADDDDDDSFSLGSSNTRSGERGTRERTPKLHPKTAEFARLMGLDMDDPKVVESLTETAKRQGTDWLVYRAPRPKKKTK